MKTKIDNSYQTILIHWQKVSKPLLFMAIFALIGVLVFAFSNASTPFASLEPEQGTKTGVTTISDATASGGAFVQFGAGSATPPPPTSSGICTGRDANGGVPADKFPGAACTGVLPGIARANSGSITTSSDGQVIANLNISGSIYVQHNNVTIRNVKITNSGGMAIEINPSKINLLVEDCELDGTGNPNPDEAIAYTNYTLRRCNIHHFGDGARANGNNVIEDNWMHDFGDYRAVDGHQDTIQSTGGNNITIRHNNLEMNIHAGNAVIMVSTDLGSNLWVDNNLIAGGGYATYAGGAGGSVPPPGWTNVRYTNNRFSTRYYEKCGYWGPITATDNATLSGNVWHDDYGTGDYSTTRQYPNGDGPRKGRPIN